MALTYFGNITFSQCASERWIFDPFGLDRLVVPFCGPYSGLSAFLSSLNVGQASSIDTNMLLAEWVVTSNQTAYPKLDLTYIGKRGGVLPPPRRSNGSSIATASKTNGSIQLDVLYHSPWTKFSWIDVSGTTIRYQGFDNPGEIVIETRRMNGHVPIYFGLSNNLVAAQFAPLPEARAQVEDYLERNEALVEQVRQQILAYFNSSFAEVVLLTEFTSVEMIPGRYFECSATKSKLLLPT